MIHLVFAPIHISFSAYNKQFSSDLLLALVDCNLFDFSVFNRIYQIGPVISSAVFVWFYSHLWYSVQVDEFLQKACLFLNFVWWLICGPIGKLVRKSWACSFVRAWAVVSLICWNSRNEKSVSHTHARSWFAILVYQCVFIFDW